VAAFNHAFGYSTAHDRHRLDLDSISVRKRLGSSFGLLSDRRSQWLRFTRRCRRRLRPNRLSCGRRNGRSGWLWSHFAFLALYKTKYVLLCNSAADAGSFELRDVDAVFSGNLAYNG
jgi:hypothetical protein